MVSSVGEDAFATSIIDLSIQLRGPLIWITSILLFYGLSQWLLRCALAVETAVMVVSSSIPS